MSYQEWFEHFKEQLQGLADSFEQSRSQLSLLGYALKEKKLSSDLYLNWAMTHFKLPKLQSRFFTETSLSQEMFAKWATHYPWSEECLPVAEWDGSLIIACLQPPQDFPPNPRAIFILTEFENLLEAWRNYHATNKTAIVQKADLIPDDGPTGMDLSVLTTTKQTSADSFSFDDLELKNSSSDEDSDTISLDENPAPEESAGTERLDGLFDGPTVIRLEALGNSKQPLEPSVPPPPPVATTGKVATVPLSIPKIPVPPIPNIVEEKTEPQAESLRKAEPIPAPVTANVDLLEIPPDVSELDQLQTNDSTNDLTSTAENISKPVHKSIGIVKPILNPLTMGHFTLDKIKKKNAHMLNDKIKTTLSQMKTQFEKSIILSLDEQETQVVPFAWDESFQDIKDTSISVPLQTPSIFNIVSATQKPFHGYISPNKINQDFFVDWNNGNIPEHVTITPIIIDEKVIGMLMGFGTKSNYNKDSLNLAEKLSSDFVKGLQAA
ncbi:MAG: hypothetical protein ACXVCY_08480 [Pseudobdellovibrionaceae bacterium]